MIGNEVSGKSPRVCFIPGTVPVHNPSLLPRTAAYKHADGKKIDGKRVVVDVERGRTVKSWKPRRLGEGTHYLLLIIFNLQMLFTYVHAKCICIINSVFPRIKKKGEGFMPGRIHC